MSNRVVITGLGVMSSIGTDVPTFWEGVLNGKNGIKPVQSFNTDKYKVHFGGEIEGFDPAEHVFRLEPSEMGETSQLAIAATRQAIAQSGIDVQSLNPRLGVCFGTTTGEAPVIERFNDRLLNENDKLEKTRFTELYPCHMIAVHVAREFLLAGPNRVLPCACAAGNYAIAHSFDLIRSGRADAMIAGGADAFSRITYTGFARLGAIAPELCQPFDRERRGMVPGEGAGAIVMESYDSAVGRGAPILAEVSGYGLSCDAHHMTAAHPEGAGAAAAMLGAIKQARINYSDIDYICAHGTGTKLSDRLETVAIKRVFNGSAYKTPVSSIKSMIGHSMGAASAIEAVACTLAVSEGVIPPTINWENPDPDCDLDYVVSGAREKKLQHVLSNAYAFGGANGVVAFSNVS